MLTWRYPPRSDHMVKHFFAKLFLCEQKKRAVQHAMLVGFLALLCPDKEVHMILKNINKTGNSQLAITAHCDFLTRIFVGNNKNSAGYYLYAEQFTVLNP